MAKAKKKTKKKRQTKKKKRPAKKKAKAPKKRARKKKKKKKKASRKPKAKPIAETSRGEERRRHPRVPFLRTVRYSFENVESFEEKHAADISMGGMFIQTDAPEPAGTVLHFAFEASGNKIFAGFARVVRVNEPGDDQDVGMGIEFLKLDDESKEALRALLSRV